MADITTQQTIDATLAALGSKATYTGAGTSILAWLVSSQAAFLFGIVLGMGGFVVNWYYKHREDKRQQVEFERRMKDYK